MVNVFWGNTQEMHLGSTHAGFAWCFTYGEIHCARGAGVLIEGGGQCTGSGGGRPHLKDVGGGMIRGFVLPGR